MSVIARQRLDPSKPRERFMGTTGIDTIEKQQLGRIVRFSALPTRCISVTAPIHSFAFEVTFYRGLRPGRNDRLILNRLIQ